MVLSQITCESHEMEGANVFLLEYKKFIKVP